MEVKLDGEEEGGACAYGGHFERVELAQEGGGDGEEVRAVARLSK